jgi:parvulin-like peptidyl-prolyl isomerase
LSILGFAVVSLASAPNPPIVGSPIGNSPSITNPAILQFTVDRLAAVVGADPIFLSDVREAMRLRVLEPGGMLAPAGEELQRPAEEQALERLINRRLVLAEVARYLQQTPSEADVDRAMQTWSARFDTAADRDAALASGGGSAATVRAFLADSIRINGDIDQRFTAAAQPTREEARAYYDANPSRFSAGGGVPAFDDVEDEVRRRLADVRRVELVREWLRGLRDRAQVRVLR